MSNSLMTFGRRALSVLLLSMIEPLMRCIEPSTRINHSHTSSALKVHAKTSDIIK